MSSFVVQNVNKRLVIAALVYVIWILCFAFFNYSSKKSDIYHHIDELLVSSALVTSSLLPDTLHSKTMSATDVSKEQSLQFAHTLSNYIHQTDVIYIYSLIEESDKIYFTSSSATSKELSTGEGITHYFDEYKSVDPRVHKAFHSNQPLFLEYTDQWGTFRSVFIPQHAKDGRLFLVAADIPITHIHSLLQQDFYQTILITLLFLAFMIPLYKAMTRKIAAESKRLKQQVNLQNKAILEQSEHLKLAMQSAQQSWFDIDIRKHTIIINLDNRLTDKENLQQPVFLSLGDWAQLLHPDDRIEVMESYQALISDNKEFDIEYRQHHPKGGYVWLHSVGELISWNDNELDKHVVGITTNITERKQSEIVLRTFAESVSNSEQNIYQEIVLELVATHNIDTALISQIDPANPDIVHTLAVCCKGEIVDNIQYELKGTPCEHSINEGACFLPDNIQILFPEDHLLVEMGANSYIGSAIFDQKGKQIGLIAMVDSDTMQENPKTERLLKSLAVRIGLELERQIDEQQLRLASQVIESAHEGIVITDKQGIIIDINPTFTNLTGYSKDEVIGQSYLTNHSQLSPEEFYNMVFEDLSQSGHWQGEVTSVKKDGNTFTQLLSMSAMKNPQGDVTHYIGLFSDISSLKQYQQSLEHLAHYDQLTGLPNRALFADRYQQAVAHSKRNNSSLAICFIDLDHFKPINDNYGHDMGDQLLVNVANRLLSALRGEDTACRFGGDEFALLLLGIESIEHCEETIKRVLSTITRSYHIGSQVFEITASCGITIYPEDSADLDTLIRHADQAMYDAKLTGRNQYKLFDQNVLIRKGNLSPLFQSIEKSLKYNEFELHYQPKVNVKTASVFGIEALLRWNHPEKGLLYPDSFLPQVAGLPLESKIGQWVIQKAVQQLAEWNAAGLSLEVSVNISSHHLQSPYFIEELERICKMYPTVDPANLQLEILESSALGEHKIVSNIIQQCEDRLGVRVSLDDFGTGYSSLTHLRNLPVQTIKIDRSFVIDLLDDPNDFSIIEGVVSLSNAFKRELIAEGVESEQHGLMLLTMGCHQLQGYTIAKPLPASEVENWLANYQIPSSWLDYVKRNHSAIEKQLVQFTIISESWINLLSTMVFDDVSIDENWPILSPKQCHHHTWLKQAISQFNLNNEDIAQLKALHVALHNIANDLFMLCENHQRYEAQQQLTKAQQLNQQLNDAVKQVLTKQQADKPLLIIN